MKLATITIILSAIGQAASFAPVPTRAQVPRTTSLGANNNFDDAESKLQQFDFPASDSKENNSNVSVMAPLAAASLASTSLTVRKRQLLHCSAQRLEALNDAQLAPERKGPVSMHRCPGKH